MADLGKNEHKKAVIAYNTHQQSFVGGCDMATLNHLPSGSSVSLNEYLKIDAESTRHTELVDGEITPMSPMTSGHAVAQQRVFLAFASHFSHEEVRMSGSVIVNDYTMLEPDVYLLEKGTEIPDHEYAKASQVELVVEIAFTTLKTDLQNDGFGKKLALYAKAGVPCVWVIDVKGKELHEFRNPKDGIYLTKRVPSTTVELRGKIFQVTDLM